MTLLCNKVDLVIFFKYLFLIVFTRHQPDITYTVSWAFIKIILCLPRSVSSVRCRWWVPSSWIASTTTSQPGFLHVTLCWRLSTPGRRSVADFQDAVMCTYSSLSHPFAAENGKVRLSLSVQKSMIMSATRRRPSCQHVTLYWSQSIPGRMSRADACWFRI